MTEQNKSSFLRLFWKFLPWLILLILLLTIIGFYFAITAKTERVRTASRQAPIERPAVRVVTQIIEPTALEDKLNLPATVHAWEDLMVKTQVEGRIIEVYVEEGERVTKGELLAQIDKSDYRNNLESIRARYELARLNYERFKELLEADAIAQAQFDEAKYTLEELEASLESAKLSLERTDIEAPISGYVDEVPVSKGDLLAFGDPVAQILQIDPLKVDVAIPEADAAQVKDVEGSWIIVSALGEKEFFGEKIFFSKQPEEPAMVYTFRLRLDNSDNAVLPGMFARAHIVKRAFPNALAVPLYAVIARDDRKFVYTVEDGIVQRKDVVTGILDGWMVQIISGITAGDEVVIVGHRGIEEGQRVEVVKSVRDPSQIVISPATETPLLDPLPGMRRPPS